MPNIADAGSVKKAESKEKRRRENELNDLRFVLGTPQGRRFVWRILERTKVFESIWHPSAQIHYNAGQQDFGHYLFGEIAEAEETAILQMMQESKRQKMEDSNG